MWYEGILCLLSNQLLKLQSENERLEEELSEKRKVRLRECCRL